ncbi:DsbA family oxidoreductase [Ideonella sp. DXS29W]|uniref:DsbA family oxidoreductase n=1 Tax=Ideonella lacteola TaxID=2984193 RepID=A0ABU9BSW7_9BURK
MKIDFVSDVACPWCAVGLNALERALEKIGDDIPVELSFHPFELNPQMAAEGEDATEHLMRKYGLSQEQLERNRAGLRERGASVGFQFGDRARVWNTFDAHRLIHWAGLEGRQREMKHALLQAYHGRNDNPGDAEVLYRAAVEAGLDGERAREVIASDRYAAEVRAQERHWQQMGINSVPSIIINDRHLIQGGQPPEVFEQALRQLAQAAE